MKYGKKTMAFMFVHIPSQQVKNSLVNNRSSIAKKVISLIAAGALSFSVVACAPKNNQTDSSPTTGIVTPDPNNNKYSSIMQEVLSGNTYQQLIQKKREGVITKNELSPIPYHFLSSHGHDIAKIKSDELRCEVDTYLKDDDKTKLYVSVKVENPGHSLTNYLLTYILTEQEYKEYRMLHKGRYIQTPFYIQELDNQKTANLLSTISINKQCYETLFECISKMYYKEFKISPIEIDLSDLISANQITVLARECSDMDLEVVSIRQRTFYLYYYETADATLDNNILNIRDACDFAVLNDDESFNSYENLTYFQPYRFNNFIIYKEQ